MKYNDDGDRERDLYKAENLLHGSTENLFRRSEQLLKGSSQIPNVGDSHAPDVSHSSGLCPENCDARKEKKKRKRRRFEKGGTTKV